MTDKLEQGMACYQQGNYEQAIFLLGQVLDDDPSRVEAKLWLGASMVAQGENDKATFLFKRVLKESSDSEVRGYALQMLQQLGIEVEVAAAETGPVLRPLKQRDISFNALMRELCLLSDSELKEVTPWLQQYTQDVKVFVDQLKPGFAGSDTALAILEGLVGFSSPRRQVECKSRIQSFLVSPERVREQILGVFNRSLDPSAGNN
jgi:tetratricopeptide (TPR) repeat protein